MNGDNGIRICFNEELATTVASRCRCRWRRQQCRESHDRRGLEGVEFIVANTDLQALKMSRAR